MKHSRDQGQHSFHVLTAEELQRKVVRPREVFLLQCRPMQDVVLIYNSLMHSAKATDPILTRLQASPSTRPATSPSAPLLHDARGNRLVTSCDNKLHGSSSVLTPSIPHLHFAQHARTKGLLRLQMVVSYISTS